MNIFPIGGRKEDGFIDWQQSARDMDDIRVVKMFTESCQLLSTALIIHGQKAPYKAYNPTGRLVRWTAAHPEHFWGLWNHSHALLEEYKSRFGKKDIIERRESMLYEIHDIAQRTSIFPHRLPASVPDLMPVEDPPKIVPKEFEGYDLIEAYRRAWAVKPKMRYRHAAPPQWFIDLRTIPYET